MTTVTDHLGQMGIRFRVVPHARTTSALGEALGQDDVHVAAESEVAHDFPEFELGALPPLPSLLHVPVVIDPAVLAHRRVTFSAGTQGTSVEADTDDVFTGTSITIAPITRPYGAPPTSLAPR